MGRVLGVEQVLRTGCCWSSMARTLVRVGCPEAAGCLASRVIVDDHREQARSYRVLGCSHMLRQADAYCRSEHARDGGPVKAGCQACRVIVDDHREQARSYRVLGCSHMLRQADVYCRSEHARDGGPVNAGCQACRVIVDDHREQARSYRVLGCSHMLRGPMPTVGASMLAMEAQTPRGVRFAALSLATNASKLAPTGVVSEQKKAVSMQGTAWKSMWLSAR